jgi:hypothetical protein
VHNCWLLVYHLIHIILHLFVLDLLNHELFDPVRLDKVVVLILRLLYNRVQKLLQKLLIGFALHGEFVDQALKKCIVMIPVQIAFCQLKQDFTCLENLVMDVVRNVLAKNLE